jgi:uncharacterized membrane protein
LVVRRKPGLPSDHGQLIVLGLEILGFLLLGIGGWLGGHLVFHHGIGQDR